MSCESERRILIIDDQDAIHDDYRKIICPERPEVAPLHAIESELFGGEPEPVESWHAYDIDSAYQGQEAIELVERSLQQGRPYAVAFVDIRMPPGLDGIETVRRIWEIDPDILVVICSAHSDYSWQDIVDELGRTDRFLILKKPFDNVEVRQCAAALAERWQAARNDELTDLLNRRAFEEVLRREWAYSLRHERPLACVLFSLDLLPWIQEVEGGAAADAALRMLGDLLRQHAPPTSTLARLTSDQLAVLLNGYDEAEASAWAEGVRQQLASAPRREGAPPRSVSGGVAVLSAATVRQDALIHQADEALHAAKMAGGNRIYEWSNQAPTEDHLQRIQQYAARFERLSARDLMSPAVKALDQDLNVSEAAVQFLQTRCSAAPVINREGELVGLLSEKDLIEAWGGPGGWSRQVRQVMMPGVIQYEPDAPAEAIFRFLCRVQMSRVIITEKSRPIGEVTCAHFLKWFCRTSAEREAACCGAE